MQDLCVTFQKSKRLLIGFLLSFVIFGTIEAQAVEVLTGPVPQFMTEYGGNQGEPMTMEEAAEILTFLFAGEGIDNPIGLADTILREAMNIDEKYKSGQCILRM